MLTTLDAIVFDFDGVINRNYDKDGFAWSRAMEADFGITTAAFQEALFNERFKDILIGVTDLKDALGEILPALGCTRPATEFLNYWFEKDLKPCTGLLGLIGELRAAGLPCFIGTNNERYRTAYLWENCLKGHVDGIYAAGHMGVAKPDAAFFRHIETELKAPPARLLLVDDIPANVEAARKAGWQAIQYGDYMQKVLGEPQHLRKIFGLP